MNEPNIRETVKEKYGNAALRVATGLCALTLPLSALLDRVAGEGDTLHAVARRAGA